MRDNLNKSKNEAKMYQACCVCGSHDFVFLKVCSELLAEPLSIRLCSTCGFANREELPELSANLDRQLEVFDQNVSMPTPRSTRWPRRDALVRQIVSRLIGTTGRALDIGCNTGVWLATLGCRWERHGVELSPSAACIAKAFSGASIYVGPIESYIEPAGFDLITAFAVIEHVSDPCVFIEWIFRHLRPGGLMVLMTGDRESAVAQRMGPDWPLYFSPEHVSFFSARSLSRLVEKAGFHIRRREWRYMPYSPFSLRTAVDRFSQKCAEVFGHITTPEHDHLYLYASKPAIVKASGTITDSVA
jgi:SAM-dependent methyltransferase